MMRDATNSLPRGAQTPNAGIFVVHDSGISLQSSRRSTSTLSIRKKTCLCNNPNTCKELTAAFAMVNDPRMSFVRIPRHHSRNNEVRRAYLRHLLPQHSLEKKTPSKYIAAHHFDASLVLAHAEQQSTGSWLEKKRAVPRIMTKQQVMQLGVDVDKCDTIDNKELGRVYIALPSYDAQDDATSILSQIRREESIEEQTELVLLQDDDGDPTTMVKETPTQEEVTTANNSEEVEVEVVKEEGEVASLVVMPEPNKSADTPVVEQDATNECPAQEESKAEGDDTTETMGPLTDNPREGIASVEESFAEESTCLSLPPEASKDKAEGDNDESKGNRTSASESVTDNGASETKQACTDENVNTEEPAEESTCPLTPPEESKDKVEGDDDESKGNPTSAPENDNVTKTESKQAYTDEKANTEDPVPTDSSSSKVNFGTVTIREYPIIPGDNPGGPVTTGAPLSIDWQHQRQVTAQVDAYEKTRPKCRHKTEFKIPPEVRLDILRKSGYSLVEIQKYTKKANLIRVSRRTSVGLSHLYPMSEAKERWTRGLSNITFRKAEKQREREFLQASLRINHKYGFKKRVSQQLTEASSSSSFDDAVEQQPVEH